MFASLRLSGSAGPAASGLIVALGLAIAAALGGCAKTKTEQQNPAAAGMAPAGSCEEQHDQAVQACQSTWGAQGEAVETGDELAACLTQATDALQQCRDAMTTQH
jgi:hypothetical protein